MDQASAQLASDTQVLDAPAGWMPRPPRPVLDMVHLRCFTAGEAAFEREILGLFAGELPKTIAALERASSAREWHMAAHTLKGSALGIGACRLADVAREAERSFSLDCAARAALIMRAKAAIADVLAEAARLELI